MFRFAKLSLVVAVLLTLPGVIGCGDGSQPVSGVLSFTAIPDSDKTELDLRFRPLAEHLSEVLGIPCEYVSTADYSASVEMFKNGDVQLAWFGGLTGVQARDAVAGARAIAQGAADREFRSYIIAHELAAAEVEGELPVDILKGRRFTFGSRQSTSGRLMPEHFLRTATGMAPDEFFSEVSYSGSHDKTAELVDSGAFEAGVINYRTYETLLADGRIHAETCRVLWKSPTYSDYNWTVHPDVDATFGAGTSHAIQEALIGLSDRVLLEALKRPEGLVEASAGDFEGIAAVARRLGFLRDASQQ